MSHSKDLAYMYVAKMQAKQSPDPDTKVGAIITSGTETVFFGYSNIGGLPTSTKMYRDKELKKRCITHAEINAIKAYCIYIENNPFSEVVMGTVYITHPPCMNCLEALHHIGIKRIVVMRAIEKTLEGQIKWDDILNTAGEYCMKNGIEFSVLSNSYFEGI